jgi:hypothetical protein
MTLLMWAIGHSGVLQRPSAVDIFFPLARVAQDDNRPYTHYHYCLSLNGRPESYPKLGSDIPSCTPH